MADNSRAINRVFTRKVICDLIENGRNDVFDYVVKRYIDDPSNKIMGNLSAKYMLTSISNSVMSTSI